MKQPKELNEKDLVEIAFRVRTRLERDHGINRVRMFFSSDLVLAEKFAIETYIAVREQLEKEHDRGQ